MKKILIPVFCFLSVLGIHARTQAQKVLLDEDFSANKSGWATYDNKIGFLIYNGKLIFSGRDSLTYNPEMPITLNDGVNFSVTVTSTHTDGVDDRPYGIYFGASDLSNYYVFTLSANGYYRLSKSTTTDFTDIVKWTANSAIKTGNYVDNVMQITRQGANWILSVNGQMLVTVPATAFFGNKIGFTQSNMQRVEYDNLKVIQLK